MASSAVEEGADKHDNTQPKDAGAGAGAGAGDGDGRELASSAVEGADKHDRIQRSGDGDEKCKYSAMLERLSALDATRRTQLAARRAEQAAQSNPLESVQAFHSKLAQLRESAEQRLKTATVRGSEADHLQVKGELEAVSVEIKEMEKTLADSCYYLAAYDVQTSQAAILKLRGDLSATAAELQPRKFSFRNKIRSSKGGPDKKEDTLLTVNSNPNAVLQEKCEGFEARSDFSHVVNTEEKHHGLVIKDQRQVSIVKDMKSLGAKEVVLSNLDGCRVFLKGSVKALYIHKIKDCNICLGPVVGSVLLEEVQGSVLMLASHQIRIHSTANSDFYLRVRSRPIVEYTSGVRFAPYGFRYRGLEDDLAAVNLLEETGMWEKVDDFRWLRAVHSPNWSIIPEDQRSFVDASDIIHHHRFLKITNQTDRIECSSV